MLQLCHQCQENFEITDEDLAFYEKVSPVFGGEKYLIPPPTLCPDCRRQRRLVFRNFRSLYDRKCDLTGKQIISMHAADPPVGHTGKYYTVYDHAAWWSDSWDGVQYGRSFDFTQSFFSQLDELFKQVPRFSVQNVQAENCLYSNLVNASRNCYLVFGCVGNEDCYYGHIVWESKNCVDCLYTMGCELCYQCVDCLNSYNLKFCQNCEHCSDGAFLLDCKSCRNCFGCVGLRNKEYHIFNQPYSKEEYKRKIQAFDFCSSVQIAQVWQTVQTLASRHPRLYMHASNIENCSGDYIYNSKNAHASFDIKRSEDLKFAATTKDYKDAYDVNFCGSPGELVYESLTVGGHNLLFSHMSLESENLLYCDTCFNCKNCFGCVGLRNKSYCILNRQYTKAEYEELVPKIIEHMSKTPQPPFSGGQNALIADDKMDKSSPLLKRGLEGSCEWGEFFPMHLSPFGYNETIAAEYFLLTHEQALRLGAKWRPEKEEQAQYYGNPESLPEKIEDVDETICQKILTCAVTGKHYKIIPQELRFYKSQHLPLPKKCPEQRHKERMALRNPRRLWSRSCQQCGTSMQTSYAPERKEIVYCEACYQKSIY